MGCTSHALAVKIWEQFFFFTALALKDTINYFTACGIEPLWVSLEPAPHLKEYLHLQEAQLRMSPDKQSTDAVPRLWKWDVKTFPDLTLDFSKVHRSGLAVLLGFPNGLNSTWLGVNLECVSFFCCCFFKGMRNVPSHLRNHYQGQEHFWPLILMVSSRGAERTKGPDGPGFLLWLFSSHLSQVGVTQPEQSWCCAVVFILLLPWLAEIPERLLECELMS